MDGTRKGTMGAGNPASHVAANRKKAPAFHPTKKTNMRGIVPGGVGPEAEGME